jgi:hypothetical protein
MNIGRNKSSPEKAGETNRKRRKRTREDRADNEKKL